MDARTLDSNMNRLGMERAARRLLINEKLATANEVALMTCTEVCERLLHFYEVVANEDERITIVPKEDMPTYNSIVKYLLR